MYSPSDPRSQLLSAHDVDQVLYQAYGGPPPRPGGYTTDPCAAMLAAAPEDFGPVGVLSFVAWLICPALEGGE